MKARITSFLLIVVLAVIGSDVAAQETLPSLPEDRQPITPQNAADLELLATWRTGKIDGVVWLTEERIALQQSSETLIYDRAHLDESEAVIPLTGRALSSPDGEWLAFTEELFDTKNMKVLFWNTHTGLLRSIPVPDGNYFSRETYDPIENRVGWSSATTFFFGNFADPADWDRFLVIDLSKADDEAALDLVHPPSARAYYEILYVAGTSDGQQLYTVAQAEISDQLILRSWDLTTGETSVIFETAFLPEEYWYPKGLQFNADESEVALLLVNWLERSAGHYQLRRCLCWEVWIIRGAPQ